MIPPRTILAAIDFSETSRTALVLAARLARDCRAELHVLHAEHPLLDAAVTYAGIDLAGDTRDEFGRFIASASPAAAAAPRLQVVIGAAVDAILEVAHRHTADLVVVGSHGLSGAARLVFGLTTEELLRRSPVSVLVAPAAANPTPH